MWLRNLFFISLLLAGAAALSAALFPSLVPPRLQHANITVVHSDDFRDTVQQVNAVFQKEWREQRLTPAPRASDLTIARRLSLALTGTIPSLQEVRQLETQPDEERLARWLAAIFADRRYADYFAERWARVYVGVEDGPFIVYRRRRFVAWLSDEFARNRRYDELVRELIAGKGLWTDKPATNFVTVTLEMGKNRPNADRMAARVSRAFLGIRLDCAQCHDHPFEPWTQQDFQGLAAFFAQTRQGFTGIYDGAGEYEHENRKTKEKVTVQPKVPAPDDLLPGDGARRTRLARWVTDPKNPFFAKATVNRVWALMFGRPLVDPVDNMPLDDSKHHPALKVLADDFIAHRFDLRRLIQVIAATEVFQLDSAAEHELTEEHERAWAAFPMSRLRPEQVAGSLLQAANVATIDHDSHILLQLARNMQLRDFVHIYGDTGEDEFDGHAGTIPQRLLMMNGGMVKERTKEDLFNAASRIAGQAPTDRAAVEAAYLAVLTRRPTEEESVHFAVRLVGSRGPERSRRMEDIYWALLNSTEFSWNH